MSVVCGLIDPAGRGFLCGTPVVSDGETMGFRGMKYSLISRDWVADCVEIMCEAYAAVSELLLPQSLVAICW